MINNLVVGGAGYTGSVLVKELLLLNQKVTVIDKFLYDKNSLNTLKKNKNLTIINSDIFQYKKIKKTVKNYDYIYFLNGLVGDPVCRINKQLTYKENVESIIFFLENFDLKESKLIYPSSCSVYGLLEKPVDENSILNPQSLYAETKIQCENILKKLNKKNCIILRLPTIYGFSLRNRFDLVVNKMTADCVINKLIKVYNPSSMRPLLSVNDLALIYINCQTVKNKYRTYNIGSDQNNLSLEQIARNIAKILVKKITSKIEFHDEIDDHRSYSIKLGRYNKEFNHNNFQSLHREVLQLFNFIKSKKSNSFFSSKKYNNFLI